eukprot:1318364-Pyramimonas_sp.AAC.1
MRTLPLWPSVEFPMGHEPCEGCAEADPCRHAKPATGGFGRAHYGPTERMRDVPKWTRATMQTLPQLPMVRRSL